MNDPALAAVIFVEQPEGLCGLTKTVRLSTRVISAFTVDREGTNLKMKRLSYFRLRRKATPMIRERTPLGHAMIRCGCASRYANRYRVPQEQQPHRTDFQVSALWEPAHLVGEGRLGRIRPLERNGVLRRAHTEPRRKAPGSYFSCLF